MSVALFSLADASIAEVKTKENGRKAPPTRTATATRDATAIPEPR
jgi:hypothetical protein